MKKIQKLKKASNIFFIISLMKWAARRQYQAEGRYDKQQMENEQIVAKETDM